MLPAQLGGSLAFGGAVTVGGRPLGPPELVYMTSDPEARLLAEMSELHVVPSMALASRFTLAVTYGYNGFGVLRSLVKVVTMDS